MLKVLPIQSKDEQAALCAECNIDFKSDLLAYAATVDGTFVGMSQFKLTAEGGLVYDLAPASGNFDFEAMFVLGRGTLNFIDLCGVHFARFVGMAADEQSIRLLKAVGFKEENGEFSVNLEGFFTDHCHDKK